MQEHYYCPEMCPSSTQRYGSSTKPEHSTAQTQRHLVYSRSVCGSREGKTEQECAGGAEGSQTNCQKKKAPFCPFHTTPARMLHWSSEQLTAIKTGFCWGFFFSHFTVYRRHKQLTLVCSQLLKLHECFHLNHKVMKHFSNLWRQNICSFFRFKNCQNMRDS